MQKEFKIEILSQIRSLLGLSYMEGQIQKEDGYIHFHEVGVGFIFFGIFVTFYTEHKNGEI